MNLAERMAKAYFSRLFPMVDLDSTTKGWNEFKTVFPAHAELAIGGMEAAIAELRKPTNAMMEAGASWDEPRSAHDVFVSMIDAGLAETGETKEPGQLSLPL
jgi:hypothetical protein